MTSRQWSWQRINEGAFVLFALVAVFLPSPVLAARNDVEGPGFDPSLVEQWKESPTSLPAPPPATGRLLRVPLGPADTLNVYVDPASLSRLKDGVARLTIVVESSSGVRNIFHDGFRCETREYKTYAIGRSDGTWLSLKNPEWQKVEFFPTNAFRHHLQRHLICDGNSTARKPADLIRLIKYPPLYNE